uniref:Uncharacterized protein n=1 Tax=Arundo donax TaxID=35708 RepID=A0A0A9CA17_ARUDO
MREWSALRHAALEAALQPHVATMKSIGWSSAKYTQSHVWPPSGLIYSCYPAPLFVPCACHVNINTRMSLHTLKSVTKY